MQQPRTPLSKQSSLYKAVFSVLAQKAGSVTDLFLSVGDGICISLF